MAATDFIRLNLMSLKLLMSNASDVNVQKLRGENRAQTSREKEERKRERERERKGHFRVQESSKNPQKIPKNRRKSLSLFESVADAVKQYLRLRNQIKANGRKYRIMP